jgi:hypothetical protein
MMEQMLVLRQLITQILPHLPDPSHVCGGRDGVLKSRWSVFDDAELPVSTSHALKERQTIDRFLENCGANFDGNQIIEGNSDGGTTEGNKAGGGSSNSSEGNKAGGGASNSSSSTGNNSEDSASSDSPAINVLNFSHHDLSSFSSLEQDILQNFQDRQEEKGHLRRAAGLRQKASKEKDFPVAAGHRKKAKAIEDVSK